MLKSCGTRGQYYEAFFLLNVYCNCNGLLQFDKIDYYLNDSEILTGGFLMLLQMYQLILTMKY
jgi:hypothetical protein